MLNSIGVIVAATIILIWPNLWYVDPICTYFFSIIVFYTTFQTFTGCIVKLLEGSPEGIEYEEVTNCLKRVRGVESVHDLHIWSISEDKHCLSVHLELKESHNFKQQSVLAEADILIRKKFHINHITIQIESQQPNEAQLLPEESKREFRCGNDLHI